jgi:hypothetical protein
MRRALLLLAVAIMLAGCGGGTHGTATPRSALTVSSTVSPGDQGALYIEGALVEVTLVRVDGLKVSTKRSDGRAPIVFTGLPAGQYLIAPALRPCDGNCGALDSPEDGCRERIDVPGTSSVTVRFVVGRSCTFG